MSDSSADRDALDLLAEEFVARFRAGARPSLTEYADRLPDRADEVRELFPTLVEMEQLKPVAADHTGDDGAGKAPTDPQRVGEFRILRRVGVGGMGAVYEAVQESLGRHVALKLLPAEAVADAKCLERFRREAKAAARLHHTNIVPVFGTGEADGRHYYAMQFIAGHPLDAVIDEVRRLKANPVDPAPRAVSEVAAALMTGSFLAGPASSGERRAASGEQNGPSAPLAARHSSLPAASGTLSEGDRTWITIARVGAQVADALAYAHAQGVLHRDVKPSNLLLDLNGTVWVTDFGLAKSTGSNDLTQAGDIVGTLRYMAPERFDGKGDHRADIYALGLTLYELLTLRPAFMAQTRAKLVEQVAAASPPRPRSVDPTIPRDLETIVLKATAHDPALRYQTAAELAEDLRRFVEDRPIRARRASATERAWRWCRRNPSVAGLTAAVGLLLVTVAVVALVGYARTATALTEAVEARDRANTNLYRSLVGEIRATRTARAVGYRRRVWELIEQARRIDTAEYDPVALRQEAAGCMGDFTGLPPVAQPALPARISALALRPETEEAAFGLEDGTILLRHRLTGAKSAQLTGPPAAVSGLAFTPDGRRLAAISRDGAITVWEAGPAGWGPGRAIGNAPGGRQVLVLPGGQFLAVPAGSAVSVWDLDGGPPADPFPADSLVREVVLSADGTALIGGTDGGLVVWNMTSRQVTHRVPQATFVGHLAVSANSRFLAYSVGDSGLVVLDAKTYRQLTMRRGGDVARLAFDPDGSLLAAASYQDRSVPIWDVMANVMVAQLPFPTSEPHHLEFSADRRALVVAGPGGAKTWDLQAADEKRTWNVHTDGVCGLAFSPDGRRLVSTSHDRTAIVWDVATGEVRLKLTGFRGPVQTAGFSPDGRLLATADQEGPARLWLADSGEELHAFPDFPWPRSYHVEFSPNGEYLAATGDGLAVWRCTPDAGQPGGVSLKPVASLAGKRSLHAAFSPDGRWLAWVDQNTKLRLWDVAQRREAPCGAPALAAGWYALTFQAGSHSLYFRARNDQLTAWDVAEDRPAAVIGPAAHHQTHRYAAIGRRLLQHTVWDTTTGRDLFTLPQERCMNWACTWSPTSNLLVLGLTSGEVVLWDIDRVVARLAELGLDP